MEGGVAIVKIHIHSPNKISSPSVQELLHSLFYLLSYKRKLTKQSHKEMKRKTDNCIFKNHHNNPIYYHPFRLILYTSYLHIRPIFFSLKNLLKKKVREPGRHKGEDDDKKVNITDGLCRDGDVPPYRILSSVHVSGTSPQAFTPARPLSQ